MSTIPKQKFWMVYGVDQGAPTARHKTLREAQGEAKRLARKVPDGVFVVLEAVVPTTQPSEFVGLHSFHREAVIPAG